VALADDTEPEPDLAVLRRRAMPPYKESEPATEDVLLLIEVGDTSLTYDRGTKLRLYAEAGIPEYWVVDASAEVVEIHRGPAPGGYGETRRLTGGATVSPQAFADMTLPLTEIFA
jgi:Uma2 family endonuclease